MKYGTANLLLQRLNTEMIERKVSTKLNNRAASNCNISSIFRDTGLSHIGADGDHTIYHFYENSERKQRFDKLCSEMRWNEIHKSFHYLQILLFSTDYNMNKVVDAVNKQINHVYLRGIYSDDDITSDCVLFPLFPSTSIIPESKLREYVSSLYSDYDVIYHISEPPTIIFKLSFDSMDRLRENVLCWQLSDQVVHYIVEKITNMEKLED